MKFFSFLGLLCIIGVLVCVSVECWRHLPTLGSLAVAFFCGLVGSACCCAWCDIFGD